MAEVSRPLKALSGERNISTALVARSATHCPRTGGDYVRDIEVGIAPRCR